MLIEILLATIIGIAMLGIRGYYSTLPPTLAPDFLTYQNMSAGRSAPDPFRLRWLVPMVMPAESFTAWKISGQIGLVLSFPALYWFAESAGASGLWAVVIWGSLPLIDVLYRMRGMLDHVSWPVALFTAGVFLHGWTPEGIGLVLVCGMIDPRLPVFIAVWTLNPWALLGLVPVLIAHMLLKKGEPYIHPEVIKHPWATAKRENGKLLRDMKVVLLPWGVCIFGLANLTTAVIVSLAIGYAQMFVAIDRVRLYMWAAPVLIVATLGIVPEAWLPLAVIVTLMNPWRPVT